MHIVIDARLVNSSTGTYAKKLIEHLQSIDSTNTYTILVPTKDINYLELTAGNFSVHTADYRQYSLAEQIKLWRLLNRLKPDLVHFIMPQQPVLYAGKKVTTIHDLILLNTWNSDKNWLVYHIKQFIGRGVFWMIGRTNHTIIVPTDNTKQAYLDFAKISGSKVVRTYEASEVKVAETTPYDHPFKHYILYVGKQSDYKNIRRLGDAHQRLLEKYPDLGLVLAGKVTDDALANQRYFEAKGYKNIHYTDFIPDSQRDWLYQNADAYVFPSLMEGFGLPGLEAMGYGAPVVSSNATCLPEVYGDAAHYFDPSSVDDMARAIDEVLSDSDLRQKLIKKGYQQQKKYSWEKMALETHEVYTKALKS